MNARRLSHLKKAGASAAFEIARQDVLANIQEHAHFFVNSNSRHGLQSESVSDFGTINTVDVQVCALCGTRDPDDPYSREVIRRLKCTSARLQPFIYNNNNNIYILYIQTSGLIKAT